MNQGREQGPLDVEKRMFGKLPEEEQEQRATEAGTLDAAILQHGNEQALRSIDQPEKELSAEDQERFEKMLTGARNVIGAFQIQRSPDNKKGENLVIVTDTGADMLFIQSLYQAGRETAGADCRVVVTEKPTGPAQPFSKVVDERLTNADCLLYVTSFSRSHSQGTVELISPHPNEAVAQMKEARIKAGGGEFPTNARIISITQTRPEILTDGAAQENLEEMRVRLETIKEIMKDVESVHITSENGTDLELATKEKRIVTDDGKMDARGKVANFPFGEWSCAVNLDGTNGTLVVDGVSTIPVGELDQPITLKIGKGVVTDIQGGEAAERLRKALDEANAKWKEGHPDDTTTNAYRLAELGIGVNSKAFRYDSEGQRIAPPTSLEGEKGLGTIHIAIGKNTIFGVSPKDPDFNPPPVHIDNVIMATTVEARKKDGSKQNIIEQGQAKF